jgi:hypothetical protein
LTSTLYDLRTETMERGAPAGTACSDDALMNGVDQIVEQLNRSRALRLPLLSVSTEVLRRAPATVSRGKGTIASASTARFMAP